jgi:hypothetical protein
MTAGDKQNAGGVLCKCGHDRESHSEEMPYECHDDCDCQGFAYPVAQRPVAKGGGE